MHGSLDPGLGGCILHSFHHHGEHEAVHVHEVVVKWQEKLLYNSFLVGKPVYIYISSFIKIWKSIFLPLRKWPWNMNGPLKKRTFLILELHVVGSLLLCLKMPDPMQRNQITDSWEIVQNMLSYAAFKFAGYCLHFGRILAI